MGTIEKEYLQAKRDRKVWTSAVVLCTMLIAYLAADGLGAIVFITTVVGAVTWSGMSSNVDRAESLLFLRGKNDG